MCVSEESMPASWKETILQVKTVETQRRVKEYEKEAFSYQYCCFDSYFTLQLACDETKTVRKYELCLH